MKLWLWIIGVVLFFSISIIFLIENNSIKYELGEYYALKGERQIALNYLYDIALDGHKEARNLINNSNLNEVANIEQKIFIFSWDEKLGYGKKTFEEISLEAYSGIEFGCLNIALAYYIGDKTEKNYKLSLAWFNYVKHNAKSHTSRNYLDDIIYFIEKNLSENEKSESYLISKLLIEKYKIKYQQ